ncbi:MAG: hypothetical protein WA880_12375 [Ornithinimicrobium sp.]
MVPPERVTFQNLNISTVEFVAGALAEGFAARRTTERSRPNHYRAVSAVAFADLLGEVESKAETADVLDRVRVLQEDSHERVEQSSWQPIVRAIFAFTDADPLLSKATTFWSQADVLLFLTRYTPRPHSDRGTFEGRFWGLLAISGLLVCFFLSEGSALWYLYALAAVLWVCLVGAAFLARTRSISKRPGREYPHF